MSDLLTVRQVAEQLSLSRARILQFIREGRLPATLVNGRQYMIRPEDVANIVRHKHGARGHAKNREKSAKPA